MIPYLNEHMEDSCSAELLGYVKNLVLARIQVNEEQVHNNEFPLTFEMIWNHYHPLTLRAKRKEQVNNETFRLTCVIFRLI